MRLAIERHDWDAHITSYYAGMTGDLFSEATWTLVVWDAHTYPDTPHALRLVQEKVKDLQAQYDAKGWPFHVSVAIWDDTEEE